MNRIVAPRHPPCYLIDFLDPPYPLYGFGAMEEIELLINQWDWTIKLVVFEPWEGSTDWQIGVLVYQRDEYPTTEQLCHLYGEITTFPLTLSSSDALNCIRKVRGYTDTEETDGCAVES